LGTKDYGRANPAGRQYLRECSGRDVARTLGDTGIRILVRIMGLLLVALAVQYLMNGVADLGVIATQSAQ